MLCELNQTMMPLAPTPIAAVPSKPKIGFSIDSIVGGGGGGGGKASHLIPKHHPNTSETSDLNSPPSSPGSSIASHRYNANLENNRTTSHSPHRSSPDSVRHRQRHNSGSSNLSLSPNSSPTPPGHHNTHIIRPSVVNPGGGVLGGGGGFNNEGMKGLYLPEQLVHPSHHHHHHQLALAAAHFQAAGLAAALNHGAGGGGGGGGFPGAAALGGGGQGGGHLPPHHPAHSAVPRDSYPLYPWLLSRHGRIFPHRFPAGPDIPGFLLQPFRKPKRIRTAFSPSQLLKLEHAFEKNHYVVGAERKQLAQALSLTETQVKVWFQNRRTKHKRMQQEEEAKAQQQAAASNKNNHHVSKWKQETQASTTDVATPAADKGAATPQTPQQYNDIEVDVDSCSSGEEET